MPTLNPDSKIPLYHQLADVLLDRIRQGEYALGSRIPSEPELARTFGIGRPTVRQATDQLIRKRCLERRRGSGTFVTEPPPRIDLFTLAGTMASFKKGGVSAKASLVQRPRRVQVPEPSEGTRLSVESANPFAGREAYAFSRLSRVRQSPVLLEEFYLDPMHFPGFGRLSLAGRSLAELADEHYDLRPSSADQNFRVTPPGPERKALLEVSARAEVLLVQRTLHFPHAEAAVYAELYCRTDQFVFSQTLTHSEGDLDG